jgi:hypothetical protein
MSAATYEATEHTWQTRCTNTQSMAMMMMITMTLFLILLASHVTEQQSSTTTATVSEPAMAQGQETVSDLFIQ